MSKSAERVKEEEFLRYVTGVMDEFTRRNYGVKLDIPVELSGRLKVRWGYFRLQVQKQVIKRNGQKVMQEVRLEDTMKIVLSKELMKAKNKGMVVQIAKHEALHFALCKLKKPYRDGDKYFENELRKHSLVSTSATSKDLEVSSELYVLTCSKCKRILKAGGKTRKDYTRGYHSNCCKAGIEDKGLQKLKPGQTYIK